MSPEKCAALRDFYREQLLDDIIPFWMRHGLDREHGGFLHHLDRDGRVYSTDKGVWIQARAVWMLSKLYNTVERNEDWLDAARSGYEFLLRHCFDADGRMFFAVTREGRPLRKRRYLFSEAFTAIACSEYARASGDPNALAKAHEVYHDMVQAYRTPGMLAPKTDPATRPMQSHAMPMILIATTQELRISSSDPLYDEVIGQSLEAILHSFVHPDIPALLENVGSRGERLDTPVGRLVNPGHAIESAWFLMHEGRHRGDKELITRACDILDWSLELGWDYEYGGLFSFVDVEGLPCEQLEWDMKLWWPHTEALYALLLALQLTGDERYEDWYDRMHDYTFSHFPDSGRGEWFGYLHRDGSVANTMKGGLWKGPFHIPRALWLMWRLLDEKP